MELIRNQDIIAQHIYSRMHEETITEQLVDTIRNADRGGQTPQTETQLMTSKNIFASTAKAPHWRERQFTYCHKRWRGLQDIADSNVIDSPSDVSWTESGSNLPTPFYPPHGNKSCCKDLRVPQAKLWVTDVYLDTLVHAHVQSMQGGTRTQARTHPCMHAHSTTESQSQTTGWRKRTHSHAHTRSPRIRQSHAVTQTTSSFHSCYESDHCYFNENQLIVIAST